MNPPGMFSNGERLREYSTANDPLPLSGKLIPEFFGRRNIRDMFARKPSIQQSQSTNVTSKDARVLDAKGSVNGSSAIETASTKADSAQALYATAPVASSSDPSVAGTKRAMGEVPTNKSLKRAKSGSSATAPAAIGKGQQSLKGFFKPKSNTISNHSSVAEEPVVSEANTHDATRGPDLEPVAESLEDKHDLATPTETASPLSSADGSARQKVTSSGTNGLQTANSSPASRSASTQDQDTVHDPIQSKESWSKLFTKPAAPRCEGHDEPCITLLTKKPGMNLGRSFWMCPRPLGPSGAKEKNTQWRCQTFIWCSDWNPNAANGG